MLSSWRPQVAGALLIGLVGCAGEPGATAENAGAANPNIPTDSVEYNKYMAKQLQDQKKAPGAKSAR